MAQLRAAADHDPVDEVGEVAAVAQRDVALDQIEARAVAEQDHVARADQDRLLLADADEQQLHGSAQGGVVGEPDQAAAGGESAVQRAEAALVVIVGQQIEAVAIAALERRGRGSRS